jgi:hypothetical protein
LLQSGRISVGPIVRRAPGDATDVKVTPLRMAAAGVEALDETWRSLGFKIRKAMTSLLRSRVGAPPDGGTTRG